MTPVFGIFYDRQQANRCVERLRAFRFKEGEVSILDPNEFGSKDLSHDREAIAGGSTSVVVLCVAVGGILGLFIGMALQAIPEIGRSLAAAPILGALIGFGLGGLAGGTIDAIDAAGPPDHEAKRFEGTIQEGGILVTVHCTAIEQVASATELLHQSGAQSVSTSETPIGSTQQ